MITRDEDKIERLYGLYERAILRAREEKLSPEELNAKRPEIPLDFIQFVYQRLSTRVEMRMTEEEAFARKGFDLGRYPDTVRVAVEATPIAYLAQPFKTLAILKQRRAMQYGKNAMPLKDAA